jgi:DNA-binding HxlR family transcriptional regulator
MRIAPMLDHDAERCRIIRGTFDRLGDKWSLLIVNILSQGPQRFTTLKYAADGISQRMLTLTLRKLERDGIVERTAFAEVPPRVEYALSGLGQTLVGPASALADWAVENNRAIATHQAAFDAAATPHSRIS